jgi:acyl dehydratase
MSIDRPVAVGTALPPFVIESVDPEKMKLMAALLRDPNPIHIDADSVRALGLGDGVINQGPSNLSYVLTMVTRWAGDVAALCDVRMRFLGNVFGGDRVECGGTVSAVDAETGLATVDVHATANGKPVLQGTIVVAV